MADPPRDDQHGERPNDDAPHLSGFEIDAATRAFGGIGANNVLAAWALSQSHGRYKSAGGWSAVYKFRCDTKRGFLLVFPLVLHTAETDPAVMKSP